MLGVAAYNLTRAAMNEAGSALGLDPRQFSFSQAQDTLNAFLPAFARATSDQERQQIALAHAPGVRSVEASAPP